MLREAGKSTMNKKVLLIADDEEMNRRIISRFLHNDFDILEAENGKQVLEILRSRQVDALLLDIIMPEMDGLEVLTEMRADAAFNHVGVLVATSTKEKTERTALSLGADDVVSKPYDPVVIRKRIDNIITVKEIRTQSRQLEHHELEQLVQEHEAEILSRIEVAQDKLLQLTNIIDMNRDNPALITEIANSMKQEISHSGRSY